MQTTQHSTGLLAITNNPQRIALAAKHAETFGPTGGDAA